MAQCTHSVLLHRIATIESSHTGDSIQQQVRDWHYEFSGTHTGLLWSSLNIEKERESGGALETAQTEAIQMRCAW